MTKAEIRRERMRVQAAFRKIQRKLGQSFDLTFCVETDDNVLSVSPNVWPQADGLAYAGRYDRREDH